MTLFNFQMPIARPPEGGHVSLTDPQLAKIGLTVAYEAGAKSVAASCLRALETLSFDQWVKLERVQFSQIMERIEKRVREAADNELSQCFDALKTALAAGHEIRHIIVHAMWGTGVGDDPPLVGYDYGRTRKLSEGDIDQAVTAGAEIKRCVQALAMRTAGLVEEGMLPERPEGPGMAIRTKTRTVRL